MESEEYIDLVKDEEEKILEQYCGKKSKRDNSADYRRYKTRKRTIVTTYGTVTMNFVYIQHKETKDSFSPLLNRFGIEKHQHVNHEFKEICAKKASRCTYRDASIDFMDSNNVDISHTTIWTYAKEACIELDSTSEPDVDDQIIMADGTKAHSQDGGKHDIRTVISIGDKPALLSLTINTTWHDIAKSINLEQFDVLVADAETGLHSNFSDLRFLLCHEHAKRDTGFYLWQKLISLLRRSGYHQAGNFLDRHIEHLTTAAELAIIKGIHVPWTTNKIERMMREIGKRTKKKGMCWSELGLMRIISSNLKNMVPFKQRKYLKLFGDSNCAGMEV